MPLLPVLFLALIPYLGGKRKLISWIFGHLAQTIPCADWPHQIFADAFAGGGAVSLFAKTQPFQVVVANDHAPRVQIVMQAVLANSSRRLTRAHLLYLNQPLPEGVGPGIAESHYCSSVLSRRHAQAMDRWCYWANQVQDPTLHALLKLLIWHCLAQFICMPTSINASNRPYADALDGVRSWDTINPKRFQDQSLDSLLKPTWTCLEEKMTVINRGIFRGAPVTLSQQDALTFVQGLEASILYLDPPYADTCSYERSFAVVDHLLCGQSMDTVSRFSKSVAPLDDLLDQAGHIETWLLSYHNKVLDLEALTALVKRHAGNRVVQGFAKSYKHLAHVSKSSSNKELLVIASSKRKVISYV